MLISHSKKWVFVHNYRTGGTSLRHALARYTDEFRPHEVARVAKVRLGTKWDDYYTFGFTRNPWDWIYSLFLRVLNSKIHVLHKQLMDMGGTFPDFANWYLTGQRKKCQVDFFTDGKGKILVDDLLKYENFEAEIAKFAVRFNMKIEPKRMNSYKHGNYRTYYDEKLRQLVAERLKDDIKLGGYEF